MRVEWYTALDISIAQNLVGLNNRRQERERKEKQKNTRSGRETELGMKWKKTNPTQRDRKFDKGEREREDTDLV